MRRAHAGRTAGDVQHRFGERRLAGAVLAHQHNVAHVFGSRSCHVDHQLSCCVILRLRHEFPGANHSRALHAYFTLALDARKPLPSVYRMQAPVASR